MCAFVDLIWGLRAALNIPILIDDLRQDSEVMAQVDRDVMRTHPDMHFFTGDSEEAELHREVRAH